MLPARWIVATVIGLLIAAAILIFRRPEGTEPSQRAPTAQDANPAREPSPGSIDAGVVRQFQAIEAERRTAEDGYLAPDLRAERCAEVFAVLWDSLRRAQNPWEVLGTFEFTSLTHQDLGPAESRLLRIEERRSMSTRVRRSRDEVRGRIAGLAREGWRIHQSEWRHRAQHESTNGAAHSVFHVSLHLRRGAPPERAAVTCELEVEWLAPDHPGGLPRPGRLTATDILVRTRPEEGRFVRQLSRPVDISDPIPFIDPLILQDLDGNGFPEIILACRNTVYWNRGPGRFERAQLISGASPETLTSLVADVNHDTRLDWIGADHHGILASLGGPDGALGADLHRIWEAPERLENPFVLTAGDVDGDGDLDLWLGQYKIPYMGGQMPSPYHDANDGFPAYLLLQEADGTFRDGTVRAGLGEHRFRRMYSAVLVDIDDDGDLDLSVVSDFAGLDLYENNGQGQFRAITRDIQGETRAFGMSQAAADLNEDGRLDLLMVGMNSFAAQRLDSLGIRTPDPRDVPGARRAMAHGNRLYLRTGEGFAEARLSRELAETGWSWGVTVRDFNNDGHEDLHIVNGHKSRHTVRDYESQFWRHDIHVGTSELDPARALYFQTVGRRLYGSGWSYGGFEKNRLLLGDGHAGFLEAAWLLDLAYEEDFRNVAGADLDGDGGVDLVATTYGNWPDGLQGWHVLRNEMPGRGHWIGVHVRNGGAGRSTLGSVVTLHHAAGIRRAWIVSGDGYRTQHPSTVHFGLGQATIVDRIEVRWPDGTVRVLETPEADRYHTIAP